jgi:hypothetical protein
MNTNFLLDFETTVVYVFLDKSWKIVEVCRNLLTKLSMVGRTLWQLIHKDFSGIWSEGLLSYTTVIGKNLLPPKNP